MCGYFCIGFIDFTLAGKTLIDYTSLLSPYDFEYLIILRMNEVNSIETLNKYSNLSDQTKFRLNETIKIEGYFNSEIQERKAISKKLGKYIAAFDYFGRALILFSATCGGVSISGVPGGTVSESFTLVFSLTTGIIKKLLSIARYKKKNHNKIVMLVKSKLKSIEMLISEALIGFEISHEKIKTTVNQKKSMKK